MISGIQYYQNTLDIYNRWGVKVFNQTNYGHPNTKPFTGISDGRVTIAQSQFLPVGTYYYILEYEKGGQKQSKVGWLYINR